MDFRSALDTHLAALRSRDLAGFLATVANDDEVSLVMPNGALVRGFSGVTDLHQAWFADPDWTLDAEILRTLETGEMALALLLVDYRDLDAEGRPYQKRYYLSLVFAKRDDRWLLVHDQNTFTSPA
ncbi:MAG TPA: nuclear transport factor 2 family protein [Herpetosiphonaceae bacterium]